jgi:hypothetical protein
MEVLFDRSGFSAHALQSVQQPATVLLWDSVLANASDQKVMKEFKLAATGAHRIAMASMAL